MKESLAAGNGSAKAKIDDAVGNVTKQLTDKYDGMLHELKEQNTALLSGMRTREEDRIIDEAIEAEGGRKKWLRAEVRKQLKWFPAEGSDREELRVVNAQGQPLVTRLPDAEGWMSPRELLGTMKDDSEWKGAFDSPMGSGGGATASSSGGAGSDFTNKPVSQMSTKERMDFITKHGPEKWEMKVAQDTAQAPDPLFSYNPQAGVVSPMDLFTGKR